jgi:hypothetical protein
VVGCVVCGRSRACVWGKFGSRHSRSSRRILNIRQQGVSPSPGEDVASVRPVPVQMWEGCRAGPVPGADVERVSPNHGAELATGGPSPGEDVGRTLLVAAEEPRHDRRGHRILKRRLQARRLAAP